VNDGLVCIAERRRSDDRQGGWNGIDYVEVDDDQRALCLRFIGHAPQELSPANVTISGGERIEVRVIGVQIRRSEDPGLDDCVEVAVDQPGDFSTYTLALVATGEDGSPTGQPLPGFDPRYSSIDFSFKVGCPSDLDCAAEPDCPVEELDGPAIDYTAKDYESLRRVILDRLAQVMPDWRERHVPDLYLALVEILAFEADRLSYYQDAVATEAYLDTARRRVSVRRHARLVDYVMHEGCNARAWVSIETDTDLDVGWHELCFVAGVAGDTSAPLPATALDELEAGGALVFEPIARSDRERLELRAARSRIRLYTWGDRECCLAAGATEAVLVDVASDKLALALVQADEADLVEPVRALGLAAGDFLLFEEAKGPRTGQPGDADPAHRQVVRLLEVVPSIDPLYSVPVPDSGDRMPLPLLTVRWAEEDALAFPLCLSALGQPPDCPLIDDVSVARGNVVLVDHGRSTGGTVGPVAPAPPVRCCEGEGREAEIVEQAMPFRPTLARGPLTFAAPVDQQSAAAGLLGQDPHLALPELTLTEQTDRSSPFDDPVWRPRADLLASGRADQDFVVETDENGLATLRFGDGELGRKPRAGVSFDIAYRVGNGAVGNVGAGTITAIVDREGSLEGIAVVATNPLAAAGGTEPEPLEQVKQLAPYAFRAQRMRAIIPADYAELAGRTRGVQRTAAAFRWTGSWYEVDVGIDAWGQEQASQTLLERVRDDLYPFRRIGHDLAVVAAETVPLLLELDVCVDSDYLRAHVEAELLDVFSNRRLPGGRLGFFHPDALTFGQGVYVSVIVAAAQNVPGVQSVLVTRLERLFEGDRGEIAAGVLRLGPMEIPRLDNDPSFPERGRLRLVMRGGR